MERIDDLGVRGLKIIQDTELFCFGTDAVLLAHFPIIKKRAKVADLGSASGILTLLMYAYNPEVDYKGIELQEPLYNLAERNIKLNGLEDHIEIKRGNIKEARAVLGNNFDLAVANPPYEKAGEGKPRDNISHYIARKEAEITFEELADSARSILKEGGHFCIIHKARRLAEIISLLKIKKLEPKRMQIVHSRADKPAAYFLLDCVKGGGEHMEVLPPLIMYNADGTKTRDLKSIYGDGDE